MATWKRLTNVDGTAIHVNLDAVLHMQRHRSSTDPLGHTVLMFPARDNEIWVKETPDQICGLPEAMCPPLPGSRADTSASVPAKRAVRDR
jgi:hypothetical protein